MFTHLDRRLFSLVPPPPNTGAGSLPVLWLLLAEMPGGRSGAESDSRPGLSSSKHPLSPGKGVSFLPREV